MFFILTDPERRGTWDPEEFYASGQREIDGVLLDLADFRHGSERALDFGCGVGRLTVALGEYFKHVDGVDISGEMVRRAKPHERVTYFVNDRPHLHLFASDRYDFIYTSIVLQHMPSRLQKGYVKEFVRLLRPGGLAVFSIPEGPDHRHEDDWLSMYSTPRADVVEWLGDARICDVESRQEDRWTVWRYAVTR